MRYFMFDLEDNGEDRRGVTSGKGRRPPNMQTYPHENYQTHSPEVLPRLKWVLVGAWVWVVLILCGPCTAASAAETREIGYINRGYAEGYALVANQLSYEENRVDQLLPSVAIGTQIVKFDGRNWVTNEFIAGSWTFPEMSLSPGEAALLRSPASL